MVSNPIRWMLVLCWLCWLTPAWGLTELVATVDKNPVFAGEPFTLEVIADDRIQTTAIDTQVLLRGGFVVGRTSTGSQTSVINGKTSNSTVWRTTLLMREPGEYTIPAFTIQGVQSEPIRLQVVTPTTQKAQAKQVTVTGQLLPEQAYVGQQLLYRVRIELAAELNSGKLTEPKLEQADIVRIGEDTETAQVVNGVRQRVIERTYGITPRQAGQFTLPGTVLQGRVYQADRSGRRYSMDFFEQAEAVEFSVLSPPPNFPGNWLPAEAVTLQESWQPEPGETLTAGVPVTRTIKIQAIGTDPANLPNLQGRYPPPVKAYPDQVQSREFVLGDATVAERSESSALIFSEAGDLVLPEIRIPWWNVRSGAVEYAVLPARTLAIAPAADALSTKNLFAAKPGTDNSTTIWQLTTALFALAWLLSLGGWLWTLRRQRAQQDRRPSPPAAGEAWPALVSALKANDQRAAPERLHAWLGQRFGDRSLQALTAVCDPEQLTRIEQEYRRLCAARYSAQPGQWQGDALLALLTRVEKPGQDAQPGALPELYPSALL